MRKALVVGIDYYDHVNQLHGCVNDSHAVKAILERHADGSVNFEVNHLVSTASSQTVTKRDLKDTAKQLFEDNNEVALFYFAGHGHVEDSGGYLLASDSRDGDEGFKLDDLLQMANDSTSLSRVVILDSCYSGAAGTVKVMGNKAILNEGVTILTASSEHQYALEKNGYGIFTSLFIDALNGSAANLVGDVTPGSVYAHVDQSLGRWGQRPLFKTNVKTFTTLRKAQPPILLSDLKKLTDLFPEPSFIYKLDPSFEPVGDHEKNQVNMANFAVLQKYNRVNLVVPVDAIHMWNAAMESKACKLTVVGQHYWDLVKNGRI